MDDRQKIYVGITVNVAVLVYLLYKTYQYDSLIRDFQLNGKLPDSNSNTGNNNNSNVAPPNVSAPVSNKPVAPIIESEPIPTVTPTSTPVTVSVSTDNGMATDAQFDQFLNAITKGTATTFMGFNIADIKPQRDSFKKNLTTQDADLLIKIAQNRTGTIPESIQLAGILTKFLNKK